MHGILLEEGQQIVYVDIIKNRQLKVVEKDQNHLIKVFVCSPWYLNVPINGDPCEGALE
jgi:hypothetical protein